MASSDTPSASRLSASSILARYIDISSFMLPLLREILILVELSITQILLMDICNGCDQIVMLPFHAIRRTESAIIVIIPVSPAIHNTVASLL